MKTNNILKSKKLLLLFFAIAVGFSGCKKFLDINQNPNNPDSAAPSLLLPTVEVAIGQISGNFFQVNGNIWSQYWTQSAGSQQYIGQEEYDLANTSSDRPWLILYRNALINADLITKSEVEHLEHIKGMAYVLKAYAFQLTTDAFGDIPLTEALQGNDFGRPKYDSQSLVYDSIFNYLDKGLELFNVETATSPGDQDLIFQGDIDSWKAFANTLKLRAYLRLAYVDAAKAKAGIAALYSSKAVFLSTDASIKYSTVGGNENPFYNEMVGLGRTQNVVASTTAVSNFIRNDDPRLFKFYDLLPNETAITSIDQGNFRDSSVPKVASPPSTLVGGNADNSASATAPVKFISESESYFLQAEAVARGWASGGIEALLNPGIRASFNAAGLTETEANTYIDNAPDAQLQGADTPEQKIKVIITQKYYAMCGTQGFEAWSEWRRTGYPDFFVLTKADTPLEPGVKPRRFVYPNSEIQSNPSYPGTKTIEVPVWWDTKSQ